MVGQLDHEFEVVLRRASAGTAWGFRLQGGAETQAPLTVQRVSRSTVVSTVYYSKRRSEVRLYYSAL